MSLVPFLSLPWITLAEVTALIPCWYYKMHLPLSLSLGLLSLASTTLATPVAAPAPEPTPAAILPRIRGSEWINYTTLTGFFLQDEVDTIPSGFDYVSLFSVFISCCMELGGMK